jgi:putative secretion ATPase (PEP-CTERM system associated)
MYREYYHLTAMPFQLTPDRQFFYASREHNRALSHLVYGLAQEEGFIVITGEIGAGKTMLVERLWTELDDRKFATLRILTTHLSGDDLLKMIGTGFGLSLDTADKAHILRRIEQLFAEKQAAGMRCLVVIDEAQNLALPALEELRMLSNITIEGRAPFQCLLLGQPQFRQLLSDPRLEQLQQRILASYHLGPLRDDDTREYIQHRLKTAGWAGDPSFDEAAFAAIHRQTGGIPRRINTLCSRLLLAGYLDETHHISGAMVTDVAEELRRDIAAGSPAPQPPGHDDDDDIGEGVERRLAMIERSVARHDRAIRRALELAVQLIEAVP